MRYFSCCVLLFALLGTTLLPVLCNLKRLPEYSGNQFWETLNFSDNDIKNNMVTRLKL